MRFDITKGEESAEKLQPQIDDIRRKVYSALIDDIRREVAAADRFARKVPMLNREHENYRWFGIELITSGKSQITLRIRCSDLHFMGFQVTSSGKLYEFNDNNGAIFPEAQLLGFKSDYRSDIAQLRLPGPFDLAPIITSVVDGNIGNKLLRTYLICLRIMFPEALRFRTIEEFVKEKIGNKEDSPMGPAIAHLIRNWGILSMAVRRADLFASFNVFGTLGIKSVEQAAEKLGLVLWSTPQPQSNANDVRDDVTTEGRQLAEILWVKLRDINEKAGNLHGEIHVVDGLAILQQEKGEFAATHDIFSHSSDNCLTGIKPTDFIPLEGPTRAISAYDSFWIDVSLHDFPNPKDEAIKGMVEWNYFADNEYDLPITTKVEGKYGSVDICYAVYRNAVLATVQVEITNGDNVNPAKVYGTLNASNTLPDQQPITLFEKNNEECENVNPKEKLPLQRYTVVVPLGQSVIIDVDLKDPSSPDDPIAEGSLKFRAAASGSKFGIIGGQYGSVKVTVTWLSSFVD